MDYSAAPPPPVLGSPGVKVEVGVLSGAIVVLGDDVVDVVELVDGELYVCAAVINSDAAAKPRTVAEISAIILFLFMF